MQYQIQGIFLCAFALICNLKTIAEIREKLKSLWGLYMFSPRLLEKGSCNGWSRIWKKSKNLCLGKAYKVQSILKSLG